MSATIKTSIPSSLTNIKQKFCDSVEIPQLTKCCCCIPLRRGLLAFAYFNLALSMFLAVITCMILSSEYIPVNVPSGSDSLYPRYIVEVVSLVIEIIMTVFFIIALHKKHVGMMKIYLYFEILYSMFAFVYSLVFLIRESSEELFLILFQMTIQIYLAVLIYSSIVKMERDGSVKYVRDNGDPA